MKVLLLNEAHSTWHAAPQMTDAPSLRAHAAGWLSSGGAFAQSMSGGKAMLSSGRTLTIGLAVLATALVSACSRDPEKAKRRATVSGDAYFKNGKYPEAIVEYRKALQYDPRFGEAHLKLSRADIAAGDRPNGYKELHRAA